MEFSPEKVKVFAPLEPNINHKATAFGGSINCLMTVCGWTMMYANFKPMFPKAYIVIQKSNINYLAPAKDDFYAECVLEDEGEKENLIHSFQKFGKGKLSLKVKCFCENKLVAE